MYTNAFLKKSQSKKYDTINYRLSQSPRTAGVVPTVDEPWDEITLTSSEIEVWNRKIDERNKLRRATTEHNHIHKL